MMKNIHIQPIPKTEIFTILPLLQILNTKTSESLLKKRLLEMVSQNYECIGLYHEKKLIGICGLWFSTRHYIGKTAEIDHVIMYSDYRNKGLGQLFFKWIYDYLIKKGCDATELNTYVANTKSHKFYYNEGYDIYGFHMLKVLRKDDKFY